MSHTTITLGNQTFNLGTAMADEMRRTAYFMGDTSAKLTDDEIRILQSLGIDDEMQNRLKSELPAFFAQLPECQTDTELILSTKCEIPYYVVWTTLFKNKIATDERITAHAAAHPPVSDLETAMHGKMIQGLSAYNPDVYDELFTPINSVSPVDSNEQIKRMFTLIFLNGKK